MLNHNKNVQLYSHYFKVYTECVFYTFALLINKYKSPNFLSFFCQNLSNFSDGNHNCTANVDFYTSLITSFDFKMIFLGIKVWKLSIQKVHNRGFLAKTE